MADHDATLPPVELDHVVVRQGRAEAVRLGHSYVGAEHLLLGILRTPDAEVDEAFDRSGTDRRLVREALLATISNVNCCEFTPAELPLTSRAKKVVSLVAIEARASEGTVITARHFLNAILTEGGNVAAHVLHQHGLPAKIESPALNVMAEQLKQAGIRFDP